MISIYFYSIISVLVVSLVSLFGVFTLSLKEVILRKYIFLLVSLAVGALLGDAFIHLIPEAFEVFGNPTQLSIAIIAGILIFFILEKFLHWHHHHIDDEEKEKVHPVGKMVLVSDGVHNFIDGLIIGVSYLAGVEVGIATTIAIILHEIPQEIGDFGILMHSGYTVKRALWLNFVSAIIAVFGTGLALVLGNASELLAVLLLPFAAGGFIYIAMSDLIPEMHKMTRVKHSFLQLFAIIIGIGAMMLLLGLE
ncbi:ZIP family metal transporter [Patescibacteria group bacterium]|nr:ZIP family metal transporter [Patescibacteria group bacterium]